MSYTKHNFVSGDTLLASDLNAMEDQIAANEQTGLDLKSAINDPVTGLATKAPAIIDTASGAIASFEDGADGMPIKALTVNIEPVQYGNGDPSPSNIRPISGWTSANVMRTGKNLLNLVESEMVSSGWDRSFPINVKAGTYIISCQNQFGARSTLGVRTVLRDSDNNTVVKLTSDYTFGNTVFSGSAVTITEEQAKLIKNITFECRAGQTTISDITRGNIQLELSSTATAYEPYSGNTYPISWQTEAGTVYGGTLDVTNGVLSISWKKYTFTGAENPYIQQTGRVAVKFVTGSNIGTSSHDAPCSDFIAIVAAEYAYIYTSMTADELKSYFTTNSVDIVYKLATPIEITLTAQQIETLLGTNNIWADCGPVDVEYRADTKLYIQKVNAPTDDDMTADTQIASGKYFIIGNTLYLSTTTIPAGDSIIPGTNCTKTDLAAALNALNT